MIKSKFIFTVSLISTLATLNAANADVASKGYVDDIVGAISADVEASVTGAGNVITNVSASGNTITATKGITAEETKNKVTTIRDTATATDTAYPSEKAVATALEKKLENTATGSKAFSTGGATATIEDALAIGVGASAYGIESTVVGTNASVGDYSVAMGAYAQAEQLSVAVGQSATAGDVGAVAIGETAIANGTNAIQLGGGVNGTPNTFSVGLGAGKNYKLLGSDGKIPSERLPDTVLTSDDIDGKVDVAQGSGAANKAVITNASGNVTTGTISSAMIADGAVTSAKIADGTITNSDISATAKIATSKIDGLATVATSGSYDDLTDKPTIPEAITVDSALSSDSTNPVQNKVINTALAGKLSTTGTAAKATADASGNVITTTYATKAQLTALDSTVSGTGAVVTGVSQTDGKVTVTKGNVQIPVGSATATTYATMWVE